MSKIDSTARVEDGAVVGDDVSIGPYCVIGPNVVIGAECRLVSHVHIEGHTTIGPRTAIFPFASLGTAPQALAYRGEPTLLEIGADCTIREAVTMNTGTVGGGGVTRVGDRGYFMSNSHVAHDCQVGNDVIFATSATLGGHCMVGDHVFMGGITGVHQFVRIGAQAMLGGVSGLLADVIPYGLANGPRAMLEGLNIVGMRRRGFTAERLRIVRAFYRELFHAAGTFAVRLEAAERAVSSDSNVDPAVIEIMNFIRSGDHRRLCMARQNGNVDE